MSRLLDIDASPGRLRIRLAGRDVLGDYSWRNSSLDPAQCASLLLPTEIARWTFRLRALFSDMF
jgi:hypothetical protein